MKNTSTRLIAIAMMLSFLLGLGLMVGLSQAEGPAPNEQIESVQVALGSAFNYQGYLQDNGQPANGAYDFQFTLYDAAVGGAQAGNIVTLNDVPVQNGLFTVQLDFGSNAFDGNARWLEIAVRPGSSTGNYTILAPRQELSATPYALYSLSAPWSGLTGVPAGFADGVDNDTTYSAGAGLTLSGTQFSLVGSYQLPQNCANNEIPKWNGTAWTCSADNAGTGDITSVAAGDGLTGGGTTGAVTLTVNFGGNGTAKTVARSDHNHDATYQKQYVRTIVVSPVGDGTNTVANGNALLAALSSITSTRTLTNAYLIKVEPGIYDIQNNALTMKAYVDIEGSGRDITIIRGAGNTTGNALINGSPNAELRDLTIENYGGSTKAVAVDHTNTITMTLRNVAISVDNTQYGLGIRNSGAMELYQVRVRVKTTGTTAESVGISNTNSISIFNSNIIINVSGTGAIGAGFWQAPTANTPPTVIPTAFIYNSQIDAIPSSAGTMAYAVYNMDGSASIRNSVIGGYASNGIYYQNTDPTFIKVLNVDSSFVTGFDYSVYQTGGEVNIGVSQLDGPITNTIGSGGTLNCAYVYGSPIPGLGIAPIACP